MLVLSCGLAWKLVSWFLCSYQGVVQTRTLTRPQPADSGTSAAPGGPQETVRKRQSQVKAMSLRLWSAFVRPGVLRRNYLYCTCTVLLYIVWLCSSVCPPPMLLRAACAASLRSQQRRLHRPASRQCGLGCWGLLDNTEGRVGEGTCKGHCASSLAKSQGWRSVFFSSLSCT